MLEAALAYARMGWKVFPLHTIIDGRCSCGKTDCNSPGKHPRTGRGFKEASADPDQIRRWWARWPDANIGIATGDGLVVVDVDGAAGHAELRAVVEANSPLPATLVAQTGAGFHLVFAERPGAPEIRSAARGHVHVRAAGGYIVAAPSKHHSGRTYQWIKKHPIATLPDWLRQWLSGYEILAKKQINTFQNLGELPDYLKNQNVKNISDVTLEALKTVWSPSEQARLTSALSAIPANSHDSWVQVGMALKDLDWQRPDGDTGYDLWVAWSETCPEKFALSVCEARWNSFRRSGVSVGTVYHLAQSRGWNGGAPPPQQPPGYLNGHPAASTALPAGFLNPPAGAIFFPDRTEEGKARPTMLNAKVAIGALSIDCRFDLFHNRMLVAGELISKWGARELSDPIITVLRDHIRYRYGFDPGKQQVQDAAETLCLNRMFDPVLDYLDALVWDGRPRLDNWLCHYLGAAHNEYICAVARLSLLAAVRRARHPGTKFDQIIVLEGRQGAGKSEAIRILAGNENFSDQKILGVDDRKQQELTEGVWLYEIAELAGLRRSEVEHVKAFVSRTTDRARPAYGRYMVQQPRRTVFFGSCNPGQPYLTDDTGNRRFWPVKVGQIDLAGLARDRDQLWAEANQFEANCGSIALPERLWATAAEEQDARTDSDEWTVPIGNYIALKGLAEVGVMQVLEDNQFLRLEAKEIGSYQQARAARVLRGLGFERFRATADKTGRRPWRYRRADQT